jgi:hypothetical protein
MENNYEINSKWSFWELYKSNKETYKNKLEWSDMIH